MPQPQAERTMDADKHLSSRRVPWTMLPCHWLVLRRATVLFEEPNAMSAPAENDKGVMSMEGGNRELQGVSRDQMQGPVPRPVPAS